MRKLIFILAFMLMGGYTYGNNLKTENHENIEVIKNVKNTNFDYVEVIKRVLNDDFTCTEYHSVYFNGVLVAEFEEEVEGDDCGFTMHFLKSNKQE